MITFLIIISIVLILADVALLIWQRMPAGVFTFAALLACKLSGVAQIATLNVVLWGVTVIMLVGLYYMLPRAVARARLGVPFIVEGAVAGALVGMLLNSMFGVIACSAVGALLGAAGYARTPRGAELQFPTRKFFNYFAAKAFAAVSVCSMAVLVLNVLLS